LGDERLGCHLRVVGIKTVYQPDGVSVLSQIGGKIEKPQRLDPEVVGGEVVDPGVNNKDCLLHVSSMLVMVKKAKPCSPVHR